MGKHDGPTLWVFDALGLTTACIIWTGTVFSAGFWFSAALSGGQVIENKTTVPVVSHAHADYRRDLDNLNHNLLLFQSYLCKIPGASKWDRSPQGGGSRDSPTEGIE